MTITPAFLIASKPISPKKTLVSTVKRGILEGIDATGFGGDGAPEQAGCILVQPGHLAVIELIRRFVGGKG